MEERKEKNVKIIFIRCMKSIKLNYRIIITKKNIKRAVDRNLMRRRFKGQVLNNILHHKKQLVTIRILTIFKINSLDAKIMKDYISKGNCTRFLCLERALSYY